MAGAIDPKLIDEALAAGGGLLAAPYIRDTPPGDHRLVAAIGLMGPHWSCVVVLHGPGGQRRVVWAREGADDGSNDLPEPWLAENFPSACVAVWERLQDPKHVLMDLVLQKVLVIPNANGTMTTSIARLVKSMREVEATPGQLPPLLHALVVACSGCLPIEAEAPPVPDSDPDDLLVAQRNYEEMQSHFLTMKVRVNELEDEARHAASKLESARETLANMKRDMVSARQAYATLVLKYGTVTVTT